MKILCLHGYFKIEETFAGECSDFSSLFGLDLVRVGNYFTFKELENALDYSIEGAPYLDETAIKTFAGEIGEVFRANEIIFNFNKGLVEPIASITQKVPLFSVGNFYISPGLILPGSLTDEGKRVTDYAAWFSQDTMKFRYSEVTVD